jgi:Rrf2 family protein
MRISALEEYGLRCLVQLAREGAVPGGTASLSTRQIAEREGLTLEYTAQILAALRRGGLVTSLRGVRGGFRLSRHPHEITVGELFREFEGPLAGGVCEQYTGTRDVCAHATACSVAPVWAELTQRIYGFLDSVSLADIAAGSVPRTPQVVPLAALRRR